MRKALKVSGIIIALIIVIAGCLAIYINFRGMPVYKAENITTKVESTPERIAKQKSWPPCFAAVAITMTKHKNLREGY